MRKHRRPSAPWARAAKSLRSSGRWRPALWALSPHPCSAQNPSEGRSLWAIPEEAVEHHQRGGTAWRDEEMPGGSWLAINPLKPGLGMIAPAHCALVLSLLSQMVMIRLLRCLLLLLTLPRTVSKRWVTWTLFPQKQVRAWKKLGLLIKTQVASDSVVTCGLCKTRDHTNTPGGTQGMEEESSWQPHWVVSWPAQCLSVSPKMLKTTLPSWAVHTGSVFSC